MAKGKVFLVGAGPGNPGLITVRGRELLQIADLVLYDGLVNPLILRWAHCPCEKTARTRRHGQQVVSQETINQRMISEAEQGRTVVRLKGGDPYIFGRGSEEAEALANAGIDYEVVPGITAATGAAEFAGFSFTHRKAASAVAFVTGHEDPTKECSRLDFEALAEFPGTLVFYMGLNRIHDICAKLIESGMPQSTPAAVICRASLPDQKVAVGSLHSLPEFVDSRHLKAPSLIVVGDCVTLREDRPWFEKGTLFGLNIGITRPNDQCDEIVQKIVQRSGNPVPMPLIKISPIEADEASDLQKVIGSLQNYNWLIFTSTNGVSAFFDHLWNGGGDLRCLHSLKIAAIGTATAAEVQRRMIRVDVVPGQFRAEALAAELAPLVRNQRVLWARASRGRDVLPARLRDAGADVDEIVVYRNEDVEQFDPGALEMIRSGDLHWIGLSSPSIARQFVKLVQAADLKPAELRTKIATISPVTTAALSECGFSVAAEADTFTWDGIIEAIEKTTASA
ncbi:MAG: uroporphyrinogen-III C-methyltransferase [Planctomycetaceae bacterium]|nr:uroporphyrinogen-III C-methyltransferase [Planctomycetaceae bacterium]